MKVCGQKMFMWFVLIFSFLPATIVGFSSDRSDEHYFRHQQHYSQRLEQAVNDFKISQSDRNGSEDYVRIHREPSSAHVSTTESSGRHHLRHYNHQHQTWEHRVFPSLRQKSTTTTTSPSPSPPNSLIRLNKLHDHRYNLTGAMQSRLFDRDGLYSKNKSERDSSNRELKLRDSYKKRDRSLDLDDRYDFVERDSVEDYTTKSDMDPENLDEYYDDDDSFDDDEEVEEDEEESDEDDDFESRGDNRNRIDDKVSAKHRINHFDTEGVLSNAYIPGTLTKHKYETLGTHEAVKQSRKSHITNQQHHRALANAHVTKVYMEATCKWPKPKVEKIQKDPSKMYVPHCTILHRCGDDTGCCNTDVQTCIAKRSQSVDLYFFVKALGMKQGTIERHTFINHTECQCVDKTKYPSLAPPALMRRATMLDCNCPRLFEKVLQDNGICRCDCSSGNSGCDWLKRGMEHFSMADRKCIIEGRCKLPTCEFGNYIRKHGRCPKKEDKLAFSRSYH